MGIRGEGHVDRDKVRLTQQGGEIHGDAAQGFLRLPFAGATGVEDTHVKTSGPLRDLRTDAAQADNPHSSVVNIVPNKEQRPPGPPVPCPHETLCLCHPPGDGQDQGKSEVRRSLGQHPRRVRQQNPPTGQRGYVHIVISHRHVGHDPEPGRMGKQLCVNLFGNHTEQRLSLPHLPQEDVPWDHLIFLPQAHLPTPSEQRKRFFREWAGYIDFR